MTQQPINGAKTYRRPTLAGYQLQHIFCPERISVIEASTKVGKTVGCIAWIIEQAIINGGPGRQFWWVAPSFSQAKIAYSRCKRGLTPAGSRLPNETALTITLVNGSIIAFKSGEVPDNLYGENVYACVIDEASRVREDAWFAIRSTLTKTKGKVRIIGNIKGTKNWAYRFARRAEGGEKDMHYARLTCADAVAAGILDQEDVERAKRELPEKVFNELYLSIPNEDGNNPFGLTHIRDCVIPILSPKPARVFGVDLAKSVDWTVVIGLDQAGNVCKLERWQGPWTETKTRILSIVGHAKTLVDSTGVGDPVLEDLQRSRGGTFEGYNFTSESKQKIMEGLTVAIQQRKVHFPDGVLRSELDSFEYEYRGSGGRSMGVRYSAPEGAHDDTVCALALAVEMLPKGVSMWDRLG